MNRLSKYQKDGLKYGLFKVQHAALLWSMRLRKTLPTIRIIKLLNKYPVLISCPNSAVMEWYEQLINDGFPDDRLCILKGSKQKREFLLNINKTNPIFIINHEGFLSIPELLNLFPFRIVVFDELHQLRNPQTKISQYYTRNFRKAEHRIGLTGTWISENEIDIFQQLKFLDYSYVYPYTNFYDFRNKFFDQINFKWVIKPSGRRWIAERLEKYSSVLDYKDAGIDVKLDEIFITVDLDKKARKIYDDLLKKFILEDLHVQKSTIYATTNYCWMRQLLSGIVEDRLLNKAKLNALSKILRKDLRKKYIIWTYYQEETEAIANYLNCPYINGKVRFSDRERIKEQFKKGLHKIIVVSCRCFTHGANFSPADGEVYMTIPESGLMLNQGKKRIFDIDQEERKKCYYIVTRNTIEEAIFDAHNRKSSCRESIYKYIMRLKEDAR